MVRGCPLEGPYRPSKCPLCGGPSWKVIYFGLPVLICADEECSCMFGFWSRIASWLPYNGWMMTYDGAYLPALWHWLTGAAVEDE